ncbi:hypothetical protein TTHERM_00246920 (macronuclear) [Tetrahymena thermophila SB210]|uniref:Uncharacterized protein n=1 Tax=Tetrahymena thermophila (strain SB210) TaxID=312017 RepID=Q245Q7_TETTS|nr:hypothetical protein TTHERM_00246920 [Tetrahymena thermophila SB210]EAS03576.2 hypothetical protein TTHERM_00246920 [Tetrahymena thermophila SB210]|eukprot:XP_001023821.2 hypothetical protein TTHERM_00246920 [Tetrahymena thermophila SB210]
MIHFSIEQLITLLINMSQVDQKWDIFNFESTNVFLSKEISELYDSLKQIHLFLLQTSENFFEQNSSEILLKLTRNIEFFKKFENLNAVGIAYNNIGYILLSQELYMQSLESFQQSIIYAKYEIQQFLRQNPSSQYAQILEQVSFNSQVSTQIQKSNFQDKQKETSQNQQGILITSSLKEKRQIQDDIKITTNQNKLNLISCGKYENEGNYSQIVTKSPSTSPFQRLDKQPHLKSKMNQNDEIDSKYYTSNNNINNNKADEHFEYVDKMLQSLYQRKKNYIYALLQFQENQQQTEKYCLKYNFWKEIKILMKELINLPQISQLFAKNKIVMNALTAKCQYYLQNYKKANSILIGCENDILKYRMQERSIYQKKQKRLSNYQESTYYKPEINLPSFAQKNQSRQTIDYDYLNTRKKSTIIELSNIKSKNISNTPLQLIFSDDQNSLISLSSKVQIPYSKNQIFSLNHSTSNLNQFDCSNSPSKLKQQRRKSKKLDLLEGDTSDLSLWNSDELEKDIDQNQNRFKYFVNVKKLNKFSNQNLIQNKFNMYLQQRFSFNSTTQYPQSYNSKQVDAQNISNNKKKESKQSILFKQQIKQSSIVINENNIEQLFTILRKYEKDYQDNTQIEKFTSLENIDCMFNYCKAEFLFSEKRFLESGLILVDLFETKQNFMSQIRYKITFLMKQVLDKLKINNEEFNQFYCKFNPNITTQIVMIYCQPLEIKQILETTQLLSNLINTTLTNEKDQIQILFSDREMKTITTYLSLIKISKIKSLIKYIVQDIIEILTRQHSSKELIFQAIEQVVQNTQKKYSINTIQKSTNNETVLNQQQKQSFQISNQQNYKQKQQKQQGQDTSQKQNNSSTNLEGVYQQQKEKQNFSNNLNKINIFQQYINNFIQNDLELSHINTFNLKNNNNYNQCKEDKFYQENQNGFSKNINLSNMKKNNQKCVTRLNLSGKILNNKGDDTFENSISNISNSQDCFSKKSVNDDVQLNNIKNQYFHTSIKKAISDLLLQNKFTCQSQKNKSFSQKLQTCLYTQQFIIFSTDEISIIEDAQFLNLCEVLREYYIQLIIYSNKKSNNFIECMDGQALAYKGIEIIKVFYSNQDVYDYLKNSRDTYHKYIYPIVIQHF